MLGVYFVEGGAWVEARLAAVKLTDSLVDKLDKELQLNLSTEQKNELNSSILESASEGNHTPADLANEIKAEIKDELTPEQQAKIDGDKRANAQIEETSKKLATEQENLQDQSGGNSDEQGRPRCNRNPRVKHPWIKESQKRIRFTAEDYKALKPELDAYKAAKTEAEKEAQRAGNWARRRPSGIWNSREQHWNMSSRAKAVNLTLIWCTRRAISTMLSRRRHRMRSWGWAGSWGQKQGNRPALVRDAGE